MPRPKLDMTIMREELVPELNRHDGRPVRKNELELNDRARGLAHLVLQMEFKEYAWPRSVYQGKWDKDGTYHPNIAELVRCMGYRQRASLYSLMRREAYISAYELGRYRRVRCQVAPLIENQAVIQSISKQLLTDLVFDLTHQPERFSTRDRLDLLKTFLALDGKARGASAGTETSVNRILGVFDKVLDKIPGGEALLTHITAPVVEVEEGEVVADEGPAVTV